MYYDFMNYFMRFYSFCNRIPIHLLCYFISIFIAHVVMYFNDVSLFTDSEYCALYIELIFDGFLNGDCYILIVFSFNPLLSFLIRFTDV